jgi:hypothetical protein
MLSPNRRSFQIVEAFSRYLGSRDKSLVEGYSREELEIALLQFLGESDAPYYAAMQTRREELKQLENLRTEKRAQWKNRIVLLAAGTLLGLIMLILKLILLD